MGASKWFFSFSGVILAIGAIAIGGKGLNFGIDFESGTRIKTELVKKADENGVRDVMQAAGEPSAEVQRLSGREIKSGNGFQISDRGAPADSTRNRIQQDLQRRYGVKTFNYDSIGPTFGQTVARTATIAIIASLIVISAYIALRFEWKYAVPVLIALMHDLLITSGVYALTGREVTASTVAALLTILGFSLYDTIIVFDRIRENVPRMPRAAYSQIVNRSMSEVLTRSLATSFCTLLPILALFLLRRGHAEGLRLRAHRGHAVRRLLVGLHRLAGATHWKEREPVYARRHNRIEAELGHVPAYATAVGGAPVEVEPDQPKRSRRRVTDARRARPGLAGGVRRDGPRPARRARAGPDGHRGARRRDPAADLTPEDLVMKPDKPRDKPKRPAQPQAREVPLAMGMLAWVMMGLAVWHFTIFLPDRCWGGIVGAFLGALVGAVVFGLVINGFTIPGPPTSRRHRRGGDPGRDARDRRAVPAGRPPGAGGAPRARLTPGPAAPADARGRRAGRCRPGRRLRCAVPVEARLEIAPCPTAATRALRRELGVSPRAGPGAGRAGGSATSPRPGRGSPPTRRTTRWPATGWRRRSRWSSARPRRLPDHRPRRLRRRRRERHRHPRRRPARPRARDADRLVPPEPDRGRLRARRRARWSASPPAGRACS